MIDEWMINKILDDVQIIIILSIIYNNYTLYCHIIMNMHHFASMRTACILNITFVAQQPDISIRMQFHCI